MSAPPAAQPRRQTATPKGAHSSAQPAIDTAPDFESFRRALQNEAGEKAARRLQAEEDAASAAKLAAAVDLPRYGVEPNPGCAAQCRLHVNHDDNCPVCIAHQQQRSADGAMSPSNAIVLARDALHRLEQKCLTSVHVPSQSGGTSGAAAGAGASSFAALSSASSRSPPSALGSEVTEREPATEAAGGQLFQQLSTLEMHIARLEQQAAALEQRVERLKLFWTGQSDVCIFQTSLGDQIMVGNVESYMLTQTDAPHNIIPLFSCLAPFLRKRWHPPEGFNMPPELVKRLEQFYWWMAWLSKEGAEQLRQLPPELRLPVFESFALAWVETGTHLAAARQQSAAQTYWLALDVLASSFASLLPLHLRHGYLPFCALCQRYCLGAPHPPVGYSIILSHIIPASVLKHFGALSAEQKRKLKEVDPAVCSQCPQTTRADLAYTHMGLGLLCKRKHAATTQHDGTSSSSASAHLTVDESCEDRFSRHEEYFSKFFSNILLKHLQSEADVTVDVSAIRLFSFAASLMWRCLLTAAPLDDLHLYTAFVQLRRFLLHDMNDLEQRWKQLHAAGQLPRIYCFFPAYARLDPAGYGIYINRIFFGPNRFLIRRRRDPAAETLTSAALLVTLGAIHFLMPLPGWTFDMREALQWEGTARKDNLRPGLDYHLIRPGLTKLHLAANGARREALYPKYLTDQLAEQAYQWYRAIRSSERMQADELRLAAAARDHEAAPGSPGPFPFGATLRRWDLGENAYDGSFQYRDEAEEDIRARRLNVGFMGSTLLVAGQPEAAPLPTLSSAAAALDALITRMRDQPHGEHMSADAAHTAAPASAAPLASSGATTAPLIGAEPVPPAGLVSLCEAINMVLGISSAGVWNVMLKLVFVTLTSPGQLLRAEFFALCCCLADAACHGKLKGTGCAPAAAQLPPLPRGFALVNGQTWREFITAGYLSDTTWSAIMAPRSDIQLPLLLLLPHLFRNVRWRVELRFCCCTKASREPPLAWELAAPGECSLGAPLRTIEVWIGTHRRVGFRIGSVSDGAAAVQSQPEQGDDSEDQISLPSDVEGDAVLESEEQKQ